MAGKDGNISSRLQLDGEKEYKKALNDAYRSMRVLRSELKAETAELGKNATAQEKDRKKVESLKKQIAEQEKVVETLNKAFKDSQEQYKDNQEVQDKWAEKLNKAREALAKMKSEMEGAENGLRGISSETKEATESLSQANGQIVTYKDSLTSLKDLVVGIGGGAISTFSHATDAIADFVDEMITLMSKAWTAAGDWKQIQAMFGGDVSDIQRIYSGMQLQGVDPSNITSGIQKLISNTHSKNKDTIKALKQLGVNEKEYASHWDFYIDVMERLANKEDISNQDKLASMIFGDKAGATQNDVLSNWQDAKSKYQADVQNTGLELSSAEIDALDEVSHKITEIQELWDRIKLNIGAKLSEVLNMDQLSEDVLTLLRDVAGIWSGEGDRKELVIKFSEDLETFVNDVQVAMGKLKETLDELGGDLEQSENPLLKFIGRLMKDLSRVLDFFEENGDAILGWLEKLLPAIATNKISETVTGKGIGEWAESIAKGVMDLAIFKKFTSAGKAGAAAGTASGGGGLFSWLGGTAVGNILGAITSSGVGDLFGAGAIGAMALGDKTAAGRVIRDGGSIGEAIEAGKEELSEYGEQIVKNANGWVDTAKGVWDNAAMFWNQQFYGNPYGPGGGSSAAAPVIEEEEEVILDDGSLLKLSQAQIDAANDLWDARRNNDWMEESFQQRILEELFQDMPAELNQLMSLIDSLGENEETWGMQDLPDWWFESEKNLLEGLRAPDGWYTNISGKLEDLINDKYTGDKKDEQDQTITIQITANSYMDSSLVTQRVSEMIYDRMNKRFMS